MAYEERDPPAGLIFHSDRGAQYTSHRFQKLLHEHNVTQSFSRPGEPHDNAVVLDEVGDVLAGGLAQPFPFFADPLMQVDGDLSAQVFGGCHSRTPLSYFCNASIPERL